MWRWCGGISCGSDAVPAPSRVTALSRIALPRLFAGLALLLLGGELALWSLPSLVVAIDSLWFWGFVLIRIWVGFRLVRGWLHPRRLYAALRVFAGCAFFTGALLSTAVWRWYACPDSGAGELAPGLGAAFAAVFSGGVSMDRLIAFVASLLDGGNLLGLWQAAPPPWAYLLAGYSVVQLAVLSLLLPRSRNFG